MKRVNQLKQEVVEALRLAIPTVPVFSSDETYLGWENSSETVDGTGHKSIKEAIETTGGAVWIMKSTKRMTVTSVKGEALRKLVITLQIETNSHVNGAPDYDTILDAIESNVTDIESDVMCGRWEIGDSVEFTDNPGSGYITILHDYTP